LKELTDAEFDEFIKSNDISIVDFWAEWCGPCRISSPIFDELSKDFDGKIAFAKMDTQANPQTPGKFGIMSIPTFLVFKKGEKVGELVGSMPKEMFKEKIQEFI